MKRLHSMTAAIAVVTLVAAMPALAQQPNSVAGEVASVAHPPAMVGQPAGVPKGGPNIAVAKQTPACQSVITECKNLGFIVGQWKTDNGLWRDCFAPVLKGKQATRDGQPINVPVNASNVQACKSAVFKTQ
jgi:hypothetical protein